MTAHPTPSPSPDLSSPPLVDRITRPFVAFLRLETASGLLLMACAVLAMILANSPWAATWMGIWEAKLTVGMENGFQISKPVLLWINDGLMAIFFFVVGLEIKREVLTGELASPRRAALPAAAALGGMVVPALVYAVWNRGLPTAGGWGVPMATDIAFSLGVLAMLGKRAPVALKVFLTAVAIVDDLGAVAVIAVFYTETISWGLLGLSMLFWLVAIGFARAGGRHPVVFGVLAIAMWVAMLKSGVHATIAGVLMAMAVPSTLRPGEKTPLTERAEHVLHPWVAFVIMPIFAMANAGLTIGSSFLSDLASPAAAGILGGLLLGKPVGILLFSFLAVKLGLAALPQGVNWRGMTGVGLLAGIGFTMSLFIADLAFGLGPVLNTAKAGIVTASLIAGVLGWAFLRLGGKSAGDRAQRAGR